MQPGLLVDEKYELTRLLASGSVFGATWDATDRQRAASPMRVVVLEDPDRSPETARRFFKLVTQWKALERCARVPPLAQAGVWNGWLYLAHPRIEGLSLHQWLRSFRDAGRLPPLAVAREVAVGVLEALEAAHAITPEGLHHHGLSSHSVVVTPAGDQIRQLQVIDFGLVHFDPPPPTESSQDRLYRSHLAPEQERPPHRAFPQTDVFQAARVVVECLGARAEPPTTANTSWSRFTEVGARQVAAALRTIRDDVSPEVCAALAGALHRFPTSRPRSVRAFREELLRAWGDAPEAATIPLAERTPPRPVAVPSTPVLRAPTGTVRAPPRAQPKAPLPADTTVEVLRGDQTVASRYRLGGYEVDEDGNVCHAATDLRVGSEVRVVVPADALDNDPAARERFLSTWKLNALLRASRGQVLQVLDLGEDPRLRTAFVVTEALDGERLDAWLTTHGPLAPPLALECARGLASVLTEAAAQGLLHGDLRPERLQFVAPGSRVLKLRSFGPTRAGSQPSRGTVGFFRAPEHAAHDLPLTTSLDVWSFGQLVYLMLAGGLLFNTPDELRRGYAEGVAWMRPRPSDLLVSAGLARLDDFDAWLAQCLRPNPAQRFADVAAAEAALRSVFTHVAPVAIPASRPPTPPPAPAAVKAPPARVAAVDPPSLVPEAAESIEEVITPIELRRHQKPLRGIAAASSGTRLVSASLDGVVMVWDVNAREVERELRGHDGSVTAVAVSPDGQRVLSGGQDRTVRVWNLRAPHAEPVALSDHHSVVQGVAMTRNGRYAVSGGADERLCFWDLQPDAERLVWSSRAHTAPVRCVAISPDGQRIASGGEDGVVCLWDDKGMQLARFNDHASPVHGVAITSDARFVYSGAEDGRIVRWDLASGARTPFEAHEYRVTSLALTSGDRRLVSGSCDPNVKVWDLASGRCLHTLEHHEVAVWCVAVGPEGQWVFSGDSDGLICVWPLE